LPRPIPGWAIKELAPLVNSQDVGVRLQAALLIKDSADARFRKVVLQRISIEVDEWVMNELDRAAYAVGVPRDQVLEAWAKRLEETIYNPGTQRFGTGARSFDILKDSTFDYSGGSGWSGASRKNVGLSARWLAFIAANREDILRGRKFKVGDPELTEDLFPTGARINHEGKSWPPQRSSSTPDDQGAHE
jgi:hypothetical protein